MQIILIAGMPATGKTTLAKFLAKKLEIPFISKDGIKEILFDTVGIKEDRKPLAIASMDIMIYIADKIMQSKSPLILESNFESSTKNKLINLICKHGYHPITILLKGDMDVIHERFIKRDHTEGRHIGHVHPLSFDDFKRSVIERGILDFSIGDKILMDTTDFESVSYDEIYHQVMDTLDTPTPQ